MNFKKSSYPKSAKTIEWLPAFGNFVITSQRRVLIFKEIPVKLRPSWVRWNLNREIYSQLVLLSSCNFFGSQYWKMKIRNTVNYLVRRQNFSKYVDLKKKYHKVRKIPKWEKCWISFREKSFNLTGCWAAVCQPLSGVCVCCQQGGTRPCANPRFSTSWRPHHRQHLEHHHQHLVNTSSASMSMSTSQGHCQESSSFNPHSSDWRL